MAINEECGGKNRKRTSRVTSGDALDFGTRTLAGMGALSPQDIRVFFRTPAGMREKARRMIVYRSMIATLGHIDYRGLANWQPQPTAAEVELELIYIAGGSGGKKGEAIGLPDEQGECDMEAA